MVPLDERSQVHLIPFGLVVINGTDPSADRPEVPVIENIPLPNPSEVIF